MLNIAELTIRLLDFRAVASEWHIREVNIIQGVRELIKSELEPEDEVLAIRMLPLIRKLNHGD